MILYSGLFHDIARLNDRSDDGHSKRSADRLIKFKPSKSEIEGEKLIDLLYAIEHHETEEGDYEELTDTLKYLKTADALDRFRLPKLKWWPNRLIMEYVPPAYVFSIAYRLVLYIQSRASSWMDCHLGNHSIWL